MLGSKFNPTQARVKPQSKHRQYDIGSLSEARVLQLLFAFRLLNALLIRTFFQPDEYYQALEPAWYDTFGNSGSAWITWEWRQQLRSSLHPSLFAAVYYIADLLAKYLKLSAHARYDVLLAAPKVLQAAIAAVGDFYTWRLASRALGEASAPAWAALVLTVVNPWQWFCSVRTFSNSLEATLTVAALHKWPYSIEEAIGESSVTFNQAQSVSNQDTAAHTKDAANQTSFGNALILAGLATILRPTNAIIWLSLSALMLYSSPPTTVAKESTKVKQPATSSAKQPPRWPLLTAFQVLARSSAIYGGPVLLGSVIRDCVFYGGVALPPYNFLVFNVLMSLSVFYGNNDWHYYLSQGYPLLLTTALPFVLIGLFQIFRGSSIGSAVNPHGRLVLRGLGLISITMPLMFSVLSHKEVRFIYPLLPAFHVIAALPVSNFFSPIYESSQAGGRRGQSVRWILIGLLLAINVVIAFYTTQIHNSGLINVTEYIRSQFEQRYSNQLGASNSMPGVNNDRAPEVEHMSVAFLMPCHSIPWRSHLQYPPSSEHAGIAAWALTCEPPLHITDPNVKRAYEDEADLFYQNPKLWFRNNMQRELPRGGMSGSLSQRQYRKKPGLSVDSRLEREPQRNKQIWGRGNRKRSHQALDINDILPYLVTSPYTQTDVAGTATKRFSHLEMRSDYHTSQSTPTSARHISRPWPHYLVFFQQLEPLMTSMFRDSLNQGGYRECWRTFNSHWHDDWRRTGDVVVWCLWDVDDDGKHPTPLEPPNDMPTLKRRPPQMNSLQHQRNEEPTSSVRAGDRTSSGQRALDQLTREQNEPHPHPQPQPHQEL